MHSATLQFAVFILAALSGCNASITSGLEAPTEKDRRTPVLAEGAPEGESTAGTTSPTVSPEPSPNTASLPTPEPTPSEIPDLTPPTAVLTFAPPAATSTTSWTFHVAGLDVAQYRFALVAGSATCDTYSEPKVPSEPIPVTVAADGPYKLCIKGIDAALNEQVVPTEYLWTVDTAPPSAPGVPTGFAVSASADWLANLTWASAGADGAAALQRQEILLYGDNDTTCATTPDQTLVVGATATAATWLRLSTPVTKHFVRFRVRAVDAAGLTADSACSAMSLPNGVYTFSGPMSNARLSTPTLADITGDGIADLIFPMTTYDGNKGALGVVEGGADVLTKAMKVYFSSTVNDNLGNDLHFVDVTGDGILDVISANMSADPNGLTDAGSIFVLPGASTMPASGPFATVGRRYDGDIPGLYLYAQMFEDVTGDGVKDMISARTDVTVSGRANAGAITVVPGGALLPPSGDVADVAWRYDGENVGDRVGSGLVIVDITRDGIKDIISSEASADAGGTDTGSIYVLIGGANADSAPISAAGRRYDGDLPGDRLASLYAIKDVSGDGFPDLIGGNEAADPGGFTDAGSIYVLLSNSSLPLSGTISARGRRYDGAYTNAKFGNVALADVTGDASMDIVSVNMQATVGGNANAGAVYVISGGATLPSSGLASAVGVRYDGSGFNESFGARYCIDDVVGSAKADLVLVNYNIAGSTGAVYVVPGGALPTSGPIASQAPYVYTGSAGGDSLGAHTICADVAGDAHKEIVLSNEYANPGGVSFAGSIWVIQGAATLPASGAAATAGFRYDGVGIRDNLGDGLAFGDITGDGVLDILSFADMARPGAVVNAGAIFAIKGGTLPAGGPITTAGRRYTGEFAEDGLGSGVCSFVSYSLIDVTADGIEDIACGTWMSYGGGAGMFAGSVYVIPGAPNLTPSGGVSAVGWRFDGVSSSETLSEMSAADLTGDGRAELILHAQGATVGAVARAGSLVVLNLPTLPVGKYTAASAAAAAGRHFDGTVANQYFGGSSSDGIALADFNGDGFLDVVPKASAAFEFSVIYGGPSLAALTWISSATAAGGFGQILNGSVSTQDVTGDGKPDIVGGSYNADTNGFTDNGAVYVLPNEFVLKP